MGLPLPETFRAAIEKGVRDIAGKLRKLNALPPCRHTIKT